MQTFKQRLTKGANKGLLADVEAAIKCYEIKIAESLFARDVACRERLSLTKVQTATEHDRIAAEEARDAAFKLSKDAKLQEEAARDGVRLLEERRKATKAENTRERNEIKRERQELKKAIAASSGVKAKSEAELTALVKEAADNKSVYEALKNEYEDKIKHLDTMAKELL